MKPRKEDSQSTNPQLEPHGADERDIDSIIALGRAEARRQSFAFMKMFVIPTILIVIIGVPLTFTTQSQWFMDNVLWIARPQVYVPATLVVISPVFTIPYISSRRRIDVTRKAVKQLAELDVPEAVGPLIDVLRSVNDSEVLKIACEGLTRLLNIPGVAAGLYLTPARRQALHWCLKDGQQIHIQTGDRPLSSIHQRNKERCERALAFRIAILNAWRYFGGAEELQILQSICKWKYKTATCAELKAIAIEILPYVEERVAKQSQINELLRPVDSVDSSTNLLIPVETSAQSNQELLLRSAQSVSEDEANKAIKIR